ncbi:MAG: alpha/beta hydrolase [Rhodobacteraceae bacterium]|nr:alpha/beta hydrolase [Paracoccaceae bacterium]
MLDTRPIEAPLYADVADAPAQAAAHWLTTADGVRIRVAHWRPKAGRDAAGQKTAGQIGTILMFPGRTEHIEKYERSALRLTELGYSVLCVDWRGQGLSDRMHDNPSTGHVGAFADYQFDVATLLAHAESLELPKPFYLIGHSMGGCIGLRALMDGMDVNAASFSAPMWGIQMTLPMRSLAWGLSTLSHPLGFSQAFAPGQLAEAYFKRVEFDKNNLTTDPQQYEYVRQQVAAHPELSIGGPSLHWLNESLREMRNLSAMPSPALPTIAFLGDDEAIVDPARIHSRLDTWPGSKLVTFEKGRHEIMIERPEIRDKFFGETLQLFRDNP